MMFDQLVIKCGFGQAVLIARFALEPSFWNHMTLEQAAQIYEAAKDDSELKADMWRKIQKTMESYENVMHVLENVADEKLRGALIKRLYNTADTFMRLVRVLELDYDGRYGKLALRKMERKASGKREKEILARYIDPSSPLYDELMIFLERSSRSFSDEYRVWRITQGTPLGERSYKRMQRLGTFAQWLDFYRKYADTPELREKAHRECFRLTENDYTKLEKLDVPEGCAWQHFKDYCDKRCRAAVTFDQRVKEYLGVGKYATPAVREWLRDVLCLEATTFEQCLSLFTQIPESRAHMLTAMRRMYGG